MKNEGLKNSMCIFACLLNSRDLDICAKGNLHVRFGVEKLGGHVERLDDCFPRLKFPKYYVNLP